MSAAGCRREPTLHAYDKVPIAALGRFAPDYKLDSNGRVVELRLENKQLDDAAFENLSKLTALQTLSLYGSAVTDARLEELETIGQLQALGLGATAITDEGLSHLPHLPRLRWLWLSGNRNITWKGVRDLKKALPDLVVYR